MSTFEELRTIVQADVDEILARAGEYDSRTRFRMLRAAAEHYPRMKQPIERVKTVWFVQAMLASTEDRQLPAATSSDVATRLASIVESQHEARDARRTALRSLALVFLKTKHLTDSLDATIRAAFMVAVRSRDAHLSEFAGEALSGGGVLARRFPGRTSVLLSVALPVDRVHFSKILEKLRARVTVRRSLKRKVRSSRNAPVRKSQRNGEATRSHRNAD